MPDIASRLSGLRRRTGIGVRGFAAALERGAGYVVSHTSVSQYESGTTIPAAYLAAVSRTFGVDPRWLLTGEGQPEPIDRSTAERAFEEISRIVGRVHPTPLIVETLWETFFRLSPEPFCILTVEGYISKLNPSWESILGYRLADLYEESLFDYIVEEDRELVGSVLQDLSHQGGIRRFESRVLTKAGTHRYFSWSATAAGGLIFAIARDMTELRLTEIRLRGSEASLYAAQRLVQLGSWEWHLERDHFNWSDELYRILGLDRARVEPTFHLFLRAVHPDDRAELEGAVTETLEAGKPADLEHRIIRPDGELRVVHTRGTVEYDPSGHPTHLRGTTQDITARKRVEDELRRRDLILQGIVFAAEHLLRTPDWAAALSDVLERLGMTAEIDYISLSERDTDGRSCLPIGGLTWAQNPDAEGCGLQLRRESRLPGRWEGLLQLGQIVVGNLRSLPAPEREWLRSRGLGAVLVIPIMVDDEWWGELAFLTKTEREWRATETEPLKITSLIIGAAIQRDRAEEATRRLAEEQAARREAEAAREEVSKILETAADAIITIDTKQEITLFNRGAEEIFGYTAAEVIGKEIGILLPERYRDAHTRHISNFESAPERARYMGERTQIRGLRSDGEEFPAEATISKMELGGELLMTVILRDIGRKEEASRRA